MQLAYTWSRSLDPATGNGSSNDQTNVTNPYNRRFDWGPSNLDINQVLNVNFIYELPFFRNSKTLLMKSVAGGWELSAIGTMQSGLPLSISQGGKYGNNGIPGATVRPDAVSPLTYPYTISQWFNTSVFAPAAPGTFGNAGKGLVRGPGRDNWNIALFKRFAFGESDKRALEFRFETFNSFNHTQLRNVDTTLTSGTFGKVTSVWDPRILQLALKLQF